MVIPSISFVFCVRLLHLKVYACESEVHGACDVFSCVVVFFLPPREPPTCANEILRIERAKNRTITCMLCTDELDTKQTISCNFVYDAKKVVMGLSN